MLRPFAHPVACCCVLLGVIAQSLKPVKRLATCKRAQKLPTLSGQQCRELLGPFARSQKSTNTQNKLLLLMNSYLTFHGKIKVKMPVLGRKMD